MGRLYHHLEPDTLRFIIETGIKHPMKIYLGLDRIHVT